MDRFDALGDPTRRRILQLLAGTEQPVREVVTALQAHGSISQPAVSQHLKVLRDAGLVAARAEGTRRFYSVDPDGIDAARAWLARLVDPFASVEQPLDALETEVARGRRARRPGSPGAEESRRTG